MPFPYLKPVSWSSNSYQVYLGTGADAVIQSARPLASVGIGDPKTHPLEDESGAPRFHFPFSVRATRLLPPVVSLAMAICS